MFDKSNLYIFYILRNIRFAGGRNSLPVFDSAGTGYLPLLSLAFFYNFPPTTAYSFGGFACLSSATTVSDLDSYRCPAHQLAGHFYIAVLGENGGSLWIIATLHHASTLAVRHTLISLSDVTFLALATGDIDIGAGIF